MVDLLKAYKFEYERTKKYFGQHFLANKDIVKVIIENCQPTSGDLVIEIGPGCGVLTLPLLESGAHVLAVEIDSDLCYFLKKNLFYYPNLEIINKDFLGFKIENGPVKVVGNLPYNVAARILLHSIDFRDNIISMVFMFQREVSDRIMASPCSKSYSFTSVLSKLYFDIEKIKTISGDNFWPKANVDSTILKFMPKTKQYINEFVGARPKEFMDFVKECFKAKRKTLKNNLKHYTNISDMLSEMFSNESIRAEQLTVNDFVSLFCRVKSLF
jgi:16S rRNA (adenine1518-N6/adenine1519-N6)-dimethyltransferase